jgi:hypothetical protein
MQANRLVLDALATAVLTPERRQRVVRRTIDAWRADEISPVARQQSLDERLSRLNAEVRKLGSDWPRGAPGHLIHESLEIRRLERDDLQKQLEAFLSSEPRRRQ